MLLSQWSSPANRIIAQGFILLPCLLILVLVAHGSQGMTDGAVQGLK